MKRLFKTIFRLAVFAVLVAAGLLMSSGLTGRAYAYATIVDRSLKLSNSVPSTISTYEVSFKANAAPALGSIKVEFCSNTTLFELACNPPAGFDATAAVLSSQTGGDTGFSIHPDSNANILILTRTPAASSGVASAYTFDNITNASAADSQYARYSTYPTADASGALQDRGGVAYALNPSFDVSSEVPPRLEFCLGEAIISVDCGSVTGDYLNMGDFSTSAARTGIMQMVIGTNAGNGYSIRVNGNTMASGNNAIPALASPTPSAPGTSQFGINLRSNTNPISGQEPSGPGNSGAFGDYNVPNRFVFRSGDIVATKATAEDFRKFTVTYLVNISRNQTPGVYAGSFTYVALGNF